MELHCVIKHNSLITKNKTFCGFFKLSFLQIYISLVCIVLNKYWYANFLLSLMNGELYESKTCFSFPSSSSFPILSVWAGSYVAQVGPNLAKDDLLACISQVLVCTSIQAWSYIHFFMISCQERFGLYIRCVYLHTQNHMKLCQRKGVKSGGNLRPSSSEFSDSSLPIPVKESGRQLPLGSAGC